MWTFLDGLEDWRALEKKIRELFDNITYLEPHVFCKRNDFMHILVVIAVLQAHIHGDKFHILVAVL